MLSKEKIREVENYQKLEREIENLRKDLSQLNWGSLTISEDWHEHCMNHYKKYIRRIIKRKIKILERKKKKMLEDKHE